MLSLLTGAELSPDDAEIQIVDKQILKRSARWIALPRAIGHFLYPLALNLAYFGRVKSFDIRGHDPVRRAIRYPGRHPSSRSIVATADAPALDRGSSDWS